MQDLSAIPPSNDAEIVRLLVGQEPEGLRWLLEEYGSQVRWWLLREYGEQIGESGIDEAVNQAAYSAWRSATSFDPERGTLRAWFYVIARNAALAVLRREQKANENREFKDVDVAAFRPPKREEDAPSHSNAEFLAAFRECVEALPRVQRTIIQADIRSGDVAAAADLARELQTSKNSIYASRSIARKTLKHCLKERGFIPPEEMKP